ncbi:MAG TPA: hypothetical protein VFJ01_11435, partial [Oleiagrimonas sp.]|nr:hypothetical protein [Oleiagrimonas sp.]
MTAAPKGKMFTDALWSGVGKSFCQWAPTSSSPWQWQGPSAERGINVTALTAIIISLVLAICAGPDCGALCLNTPWEMRLHGRSTDDRTLFDYCSGR